MSRKILLKPGDIFNDLTVIEEAERPENTKRKHIYWRCKCKCGNEVIVDGTNLRSGHTKRCWECAHKETGKHKRIDVIGRTYGLLTVDSVDYNVLDQNGRKRTYCHCTCRCGNKTYTLLDTLRSPGLHSCGCGRKITADLLSRDVLGEQFGRLTVLKEYKECTPRELLCACECGNKIRVKKTDVMSGHTKSCGCLQQDAVTLANEKDWTGMISDYGVEFLQKDYKNEYGTWMWKCKCPYCGAVFTALPALVMDGSRVSCGCITRSKSEEYIESILKDNNLVYIPQYRINDCKDIYTLPFDFAVYTKDDNLKLIEYDGRQHYEPVEWFGGEKAFKIRKRHDEMKTQYCLDNKIELIRIPYTYSFDQIKETIMDII